MSEKVVGNSFSYFKSIKEELKKISWTSKKELFLSTKVVIISTFLFALGIYLADIVIRGFLTVLASLLRFIGL